MKGKPLLDPEQRRIRHITSICVRNLSLRQDTQTSPVSPSPSPIKLPHRPRSNSRKELILQQGDARAWQSSVKQQDELERFFQARLLSSFLTLHTSADADPFYISNVEVAGNNPNYGPIESDHDFDEAIASLKDLVIKVWASTSDNYCLAIQWNVSLCCLSFLGHSLADYKQPLPSNTIAVALTDGYYSCLVEAESHVHKSLVVPSSPRAKHSYNYEYLMRMNTQLECVEDAKASAAETLRRLDATMEKTARILDLERRRSEKRGALESLRDKLSNMKSEATRTHSTLSERKELLNRRRTTLKVARNDLTFQKTAKANLQKDLAIDRGIYATTAHECDRIRLDHIATMSQIYPIEPVPEETLLFQIRGVVLPSTSEYKQDEDTTSTALGFTAHLVHLLAFYLGVPLRYPVFPMSSRSTIRDPISVIEGTRKFPLFSKGVDKYRYDYALFLFNKNIEQLLNSREILVMDLRQTLPNLKYLMLVLLTAMERQGSNKEVSNGSADLTASDTRLSQTLDTKPPMPKRKSRFERFFPSRLQSLPSSFLSASYAGPVSLAKPTDISSSAIASSVPTPIQHQSPPTEPSSDLLPPSPLQLEHKLGSVRMSRRIDSVQ